jgi:hypothetical protein
MITIEVVTVVASVNFLAVARLAPDHIRFIARRGMPARQTFDAAVEALTLEERDAMRAQIGIAPPVSEAPDMLEAYPLGEDATIDEVAAMLGCLVSTD